MISKEKLMNGYVEDADVIRDLFVEAAGFYDITVSTLNTGGGRFMMAYSNTKPLHFSDKLTLADFKPKTKVEYVKCDRCNVIKTADLDEVFIDNKGKVCIRDASVAEFLICQLYRRVETEFTEQDELLEKAEKLFKAIYLDIPFSDNLGSDWVNLAKRIEFIDCE